MKLQLKPNNDNFKTKEILNPPTSSADRMGNKMRPPRTRDIIHKVNHSIEKIRKDTEIPNAMKMAETINKYKTINNLE